MSNPVLEGRYAQMQKIGSGTYGVVYSALDVENNKKVAIKKLKPEQDEEGISSTTIREISLLKDLDHQNIIGLNDVVYHEHQLYLIFEFLDQDLSQFLGTLDNFPDRRLVKSFLYQILSGMAFAHGHRVLHRDLKPQNLLINSSGHLKIGDFGLARAFSIPVRTYTHEVVTLWYRAPEVLLGCRQYSTPLDIWSVGCIFWEMATREPLFPGECEFGQLIKIFRLLGTPTEAEWPGVSNLRDYHASYPKFQPRQLKDLVPVHPKDKQPLLDGDALDLLTRMLEYDPAMRISAREALSHPYFADLQTSAARR